jgi:hypothetical protein
MSANFPFYHSVMFWNCRVSLREQTLTAVSVFFDLAPCISFDMYQRFEKKICFFAVFCRFVFSLLACKPPLDINVTGYFKEECYTLSFKKIYTACLTELETF